MKTVRDGVLFAVRDALWNFSHKEGTRALNGSRHSFATHTVQQQVPLNAFSGMPGHYRLKTTEIYLKSLPSNILDDYNAKILGI